MFTLINRWIPCLLWKTSILFFIAPKNQVILGVLDFITLKFLNVVPATNSHIDTACSKISY